MQKNQLYQPKKNVSENCQHNFNLYFKFLYNLLSFFPDFIKILQILYI